MYKQITKVLMLYLLFLWIPSNAILAVNNSQDRKSKVKLTKINHASEHYENNSGRIKIDKSIESIEHYLLFNPDWKNEIWGMRADLYESVGNKNPNESLEFYNKGVISSREKRYEDALYNYKKSMELDPFFPWSANNMAWVYATCPEPNIRDGNKAVKYAKIAMNSTNILVADFIGTLAAACAAKGDFHKAVYFCKEAQKIFPTEERKIMLAAFSANEIFVNYDNPPVKKESIFSKGYDKTKWGMTKFNVMLLYPEATLSNNDLMILPVVEIAGLKAKVSLHFFSDMLYMAVIHLENNMISSDQREELKSFLIKEYGRPDFITDDKEFIWDNNDTLIKYTIHGPSYKADIVLENKQIGDIIAERDKYRNSK